MPSGHPRRVEHDGFPEREQRPCPHQHLGVRLLGALGRVEAFSESGRSRLIDGQAGKLLANFVRAQDHPTAFVRESGCERGLPGAGEPTHEGDAHLRPLEVVRRHAVEPTSEGRTSVVALLMAQAGDLRSNVSARRDVMVGERSGMVFAREFAIPAQKGVAEFGVPKSLEIHCQKGAVRKHISEPKVIVELDAIEHAGPVWEAEDVVGQEVAVSVPHPPPCNATLEERMPTLDVGPGKGASPLELVGKEH